MTFLADNPIGRIALKTVTRLFRPFRFALGIAKPVNRPLEEMLNDET